MSQGDNFIGGFLLGTAVGGVVGGIVGVLVTSRLSKSEEEGSARRGLDHSASKQHGTLSEQSIEAARQGLEDKIAQLNDAIDDVRQQLTPVNGALNSNPDDAIAPD